MHDDRHPRPMVEYVTLRYDVVIGLENTPGSPMGSSPETMMGFAKQIDRPNLDYTFDVTHTYQMHQEPMTYLRELPSIAHVHASDFNLETNQRHTPPGQGSVDWPAIIDALWNRGFAGNFILELLPETLAPDPVKALQDCTALLNPLFDRWRFKGIDHPIPQEFRRC
ncbi:MAG: sugar phosphate isomerase/epimerase [Chloroflexi bacterium]|nr:sugar phosphate isomerase/epimerase [Chloroflexota bacterium]